MPTPRSLRLYEILEEEYEHIHGQNVQSATAEVQVSIPFIHVEKLLARVAAHQPGAVVAKSAREQPASARRWEAKSEYPYAMLAKWTQAHPEAKGIQAKNYSASLLETVLLEKIDTPDTKQLLAAEPWLRDTALRPYTRGLLKSYFEQNQLWSPASKWSEDECRYLNRLLIEDAFVEYIQPRENDRLKKILSTLRGSNQAAICLSGGGIRSATFALGVVQGLARLPTTPNDDNVLGKFNYLSTVSGGGYLGSWLSAWTHQAGFGRVIDQLKGLRDDTNSPLEPEAVPIRHLRQFSNYLSPRTGLFSADTWTLISTYLRNLLLVWLVIMPFLAAVAVLPWLAITLVEFKGWGPSGQMTAFYGLTVVAMGLMTVGLYFVHAYLPPVEPGENRHTAPVRKADRDQGSFLLKCLLPIMLATLLWMLAWRWYKNWDLVISWPWYADWNTTKGFLHRIDRDTLLFVVGGALVHLVAWLSAWIVEYVRGRKNEVLLSETQPHSKLPKAVQFFIMLVVVVVTGGGGGLLLQGMGEKLIRLSAESNEYLYTLLAFPSVFLTILLAGYLFEGLASRYVKDAQREWTARYGAWILIVAMGWLALTGLVLGGPLWVTALEERLQLAAGGLGVGSALLTALLGKSPKTGGNGEGAGSRKGMGNASSLIGLLSGFALPIVTVATIAALFVVLSVLDMALIRGVAGAFGFPVSLPLMDRLSVSEVARISPVVPMLVFVFLFGVGWFFARVVNTNRFSLHALYRARLIRAYLGAARSPGERQPDPFTGFDDTDNPHMGDLAEPPLQGGADAKKGPFHVVNLALNLVAGENLAWQERKAESFTVSCLHAGATHLGYRPTSLKDKPDAPEEETEGKLYGGDRGISLGTAMTISGAAASPNMGYHSSPVIAFLMTLFNIRLGWWLGNPGPAGDDTFARSEPKWAVRPIFDELLAHTNDTNPYVYLSDGGHFENLGLYEMVLRRNRFILVSDAGCDETCTLEDLGNAIRKIRIDLGIPVDFSEEFKIRARSSDSSALAGRYWALGRIRYSAVVKPGNDDAKPDSDYDGLMLYIKPGIYGNEPRDVFNYASANPAFPHESTADQFFTESQFESYRALGAHVVKSIQEELGITIEKLFDANVRKEYLDSGTWTTVPVRFSTVRREWTAELLGQMLKRFKKLPA
ncbi:MAG: hypothetical protein LH606_00435 [Cytophagaceae bacterium]|nr:hypothetical protein [Cytophagaceae bacterium]